MSKDLGVKRAIVFSKSLRLCCIFIAATCVLWQWQEWKAKSSADKTVHNQSGLDGVLHCWVQALKDMTVKMELPHWRKGYQSRHTTRCSDSFLFHCLPGLFPCVCSRRDCCKVWHKLSPSVLSIPCANFDYDEIPLDSLSGLRIHLRHTVKRLPFSCLLLELFHSHNWNLLAFFQRPT